MRSDSHTPPSVTGDPARAAALHRLAGAMALAPPQHTPAPKSSIPWADSDSDSDPDGRRPDRVVPDEPDAGAWADPPWWGRIRWAPDRVAGIALVVLVVALGAFSVHRLLASVPEGPPVPQLPMEAPGQTAPDDGVSPSATVEVEAASGSGGEGDDEPAADEQIVVSVVGLVGHSGLVTLNAGARVAEALANAGGVLEGGDRDGLNLARKLVDGEQILVGLAPGPDGPHGPRSGIVGADQSPPGDGAASSPGSTPAEDGPVDLNTADAAGLEELPGVGPVTAAAILKWRETNGSFASVDQLAEVNGIGPATLDRLRPLVTV